MTEYPRLVVARCPRCRVGFAAGELQIIDVEPSGRLVRRCGGCGLKGPSFWFRNVEVAR
jgi:hypothetical protein